MECGDRLKDLDMTVDELDRLTKAFKDDKFRGMLFDYAKEISDPENRRKNEEEIKLLEQQRGNSIEFIHPEPCRVLKTSMNGTQKCFVNICTNEKVGKPEFSCGVSDEGRRGQHWSLPHNLHPGRSDRDPKGNKIMIYDVIFHPDTLHMASRNQRFMDMVDNTAVQGIQDSFKVTLDKNNARVLKTKYKGTPQPCVIRKPLPGYKATEPPVEPDPLAFPYPDEKRPGAAPPDSSPKTFTVASERPRAPTTPKYTLKYRSFVDLQDFRCSRDSARSPRPKEIVVTVEMPLLKTAGGASVEVQGRNLVLESKKPAYSLDVPLAYPVDEERGRAKFNKQNGQLTITLPVLPANDGFDFTAGFGENQAAGSGLEEEEEEEEEENQEGPREGGDERKEDEFETEATSGCREPNGGGRDGEEEEPEVGEEKRRKGGEGEGEGSDGWETEKSERNDDGRRGGVERAEGSRVEGTSDLDAGPAPAGDDVEAADEQNEVSSDQTSGVEEERDILSKSCSETRQELDTSEAREEANATTNKNEIQTSLNQRTSEETLEVTAPAKSSPGKEHHPSDGDATPPTVEELEAAQTSGTVDKLNPENSLQTAYAPDAAGADPANEAAAEEIDADDLPDAQPPQRPRCDSEPPPAVLWEMGEDGRETAISDHSTSAGFPWQNALLYELD